MTYNGGMEAIVGALVIFALRVTDVSIGTVRMIYAVRGLRLPAAALGLIESGVFILAISRVLVNIQTHPWNMLGYACGFAAGNAVGITIEQWIGSGWAMARVISRERSQALLAALRDAGFGVTAVDGKGRQGEVLILFVVARRRRIEDMFRLVREMDPEAFVTTEAVNIASGGYLPRTVEAMTVRK